MNVMEKKYVTIAEAKNVLDKTKKRYKEAEMEMLYEQKRALDHANKADNLNFRDSGSMIKKLSEMELELNEDQIVKIVDLLPETVDDVRAIFAKERFKYGEEEIKKVLDVVAQYK